MHTVPPSRWTWYLVSAGIVWAVQNGADIISLSVSVNKDFEPIQKACRMCWEKNVILITPMGNAFEEKDENSVFYPAAYPWTIAVGGVEKKRRTAQYLGILFFRRLYRCCSPGIRNHMRNSILYRKPGTSSNFSREFLSRPHSGLSGCSCSLKHG